MSQKPIALVPERTTEHKYPQDIAALIAQRRVNALTSGVTFMLDQEWDHEFAQLKAAVHELRKGQFEEMKKAGHGVIREDIAAEAGFLLGLEVGKRLAGGVR